jgi:hypothetical protein
LQSNCRQLDSQTLLEEVVGARCLVQKYIPKASRIVAATSLTTVLERIVADPDNLSQWHQFLLFTYRCFCVGERGGKRHNTTLSTKVNNALSAFMPADR